MMNFLMRQRHAYLRWQSDSDMMKKASQPGIASHDGP